MKQALLIVFSIFWSVGGTAQEKLAYQLFNTKGKTTDYKDLLKSAAKADVVFFGESHNNPIAHWLQYELTRDLFEERKGALTLGAEMFEADNQLILNEYLSGAISEKNFEEEARVWGNYETDYKPLVLFAKEQQLPFIATNIPRRYANLVFRQGPEALENLSEQAKEYIAPLPIEFNLELESYAGMLDMMGGASHGGGQMDNLPKAQAVKDATMAHFIAKNLEKKQLFIHYNGSFHSDLKEGIVWYLLQEEPRSNILTITTVEQADLKSIDAETSRKADFILVVPASMTKTY